MSTTSQPPKTASLQAAEDWLEAASYEEWDVTWSMVEPAYRRLLAERVVVGEGLDLDDPETAAYAEAAAEEGHDLVAWSEFAEEQCLSFLKTAMSLNSRGWVTRPMPVALDCELVLLVDAAGMRDPAGESPGQVPGRFFEITSPIATGGPPQRFVTSAVLFYMRRDAYGDWLIAGFNEEPPGWPSSG